MLVRLPDKDDYLTNANDTLRRGYAGQNTDCQLGQNGVPAASDARIGPPGNQRVNENHATRPRSIAAVQPGTWHPFGAA